MAIATPTTKTRNGEVGKPRLKRSMGLWMATALVVGNMLEPILTQAARPEPVLAGRAR